MSTLTVPPANAATSIVLGYHLLRLRKTRDLTQMDVARMLLPLRRPDIAIVDSVAATKALASIQVQLAKLERGAASDAAGLDWLDNIAQIFNVSRAELVTHPSSPALASSQRAS